MLNAASGDFFKEISVPPKYGVSEWIPIVVEGLQRKEGLFKVFQPSGEIACPSVFAASRWVHRGLTQKEQLRMWDVPLILDKKVTDGV